MTETISASLARLQCLQRDLSNLATTTFPVVDRLWADLQSQVEHFRNLLDKRPQNEQSRKTISQAQGTVELEGVAFEINDVFKQHTIELAQALDLDELKAARLLVDAQYEAKTLDRTPLIAAVILFHQRRQFLLECLRLALENAYATEHDLPPDLVGQFQSLIPTILQTGDGGIGKGSAYWRRCLAAMADLEVKMHQVAERVASVSITEQQQSHAYAEIMTFQRTSMIKQHESLGAIIYWLARGNWTAPDDLRVLIARTKSIDRYDAVLVHYLPGLLRLVSQYASSQGNCSLQEANALNAVICSTKDSDVWSLRNFQAAVIAIWLAEFSARFVDAAGQDSSALAEADNRASLFSDALKDGAFHFMLCVGNDVHDNNWFDPARKGMTSFLVQDAPALHTETFKVDEYMRALVLERLQSFSDAYISNMPDSLRKLRLDEDEQRRNMQSRVQIRPSEFDLHFERFLLIIAYAFEGFVPACDAFWEDPDSNLYGFLQWASQRQSTPRAAAFCEMLTAISRGELCANHAHKFLLDENAVSGAKLRRSSPLSWNHVLRELEFYASTIKDRPAAATGPGSGRAAYSDQVVEPESALMLECYLRLVAHLARESSNARTWLLSRTSFNVVEYLILLCGSAIDTRLRACAFTAIAWLLTEKDTITNRNVWTTVDAWLYGQSQTTAAALQGRLPQSLSAQDMERIIFGQLSQGFEEPNAVVSLMRALIQPAEKENTAGATLPFPEDLGAKYRMAGIDSYVDFVMNNALAVKSIELQDPVQLRILRLNCLDFAASCLSAFNEDLVVFANQTTLTVDSDIEGSSLGTYVRIHPFARVMEWLFNDAVISALFAAAIQDIEEVNTAPESSPLVLGVLKSLSVIDLVLSLQSTYFNIVRPAVKLQSANRRFVVADSALASFEDAIVNHMELVRMLGIYSGSGHTDLAAASLRLLGRLSQSRKLATPVAGGSNRRAEKSRLISALEKDGESDNISRTLARVMEYDYREFEAGSTSPGILMKSDILNFLESSLDTVTDRPSAAHLLLGFACDSHSLFIRSEGLFADSSALFQAVTSFVITSQDDLDGTFITLMLRLKRDAFQILRKLWRSRLSSALTLDELRRSDFFLNAALQQNVIRPDSLWDNRSLDENEFFASDSAVGLVAFLQSRSAFLECIATELRRSKNENLPTLRARIQSSLFGSTALLDGQQYVNPTIFDYLDFLEIKTEPHPEMPSHNFFDMSLFDVCKESLGGGSFFFNMSAVQQVIHLQQSGLRKQGREMKNGDEKKIQEDVEKILDLAIGNNSALEVKAAMMLALRSWIQLSMAMLDCCDFTATQQAAFVLQLLQQTLPWLERSYTKQMPTADALANFGLSLLRHVDFKTFSTENDLSTDTANDSLFRLFRAGLLGILNSEASVELRETCSQLCRCYVQNVCEHQKRLGQRALQCVKSMGDRLIEGLCDDAFSDEGKLRASSLLLLEALMVASNEANSTYILEAFSRLNFVQVVTNTIRNIPTELATSRSEKLPSILGFYDMSLALLLRVAQSRLGAAHIFNAGIFSSIRDSGIFGVDPDIGLDIDNAGAMTKYLELMLSFLRVLNAIVVSRGPQSEQTISQARHFLHAYRPTLVSILKRSAGIGSRKQGNEELLGELVDSFTVLVAVSGFLESEEEPIAPDEGPRLFT